MLINWTRVQELRDEIGHDSFAEVVAVFLDESDTVIARPSLTAEDLHFLRGAALNLGFAELAEACSRTADRHVVTALYAASKASLLAEAI
ncbi:histidine kinase [Gemmobacter aquarius]|uniref:Histidine kinase n=1 Tax=Paragemmobacter aquarius TaxID=2169400 RepID=A0A2S0UQH3_9RHOB|nr:histidine kinase [Gemmobacter aquarius]AWB50069.1 histidine kinase [Gemmobacter aquarius]